MRYYEYKPTVIAKDQSGKEMTLDYKQFFMSVLTADSKITSEQFLRLSALYQRAKDLKENEFLELEDQDYVVVVTKFNDWVLTLKGFTIGMPEVGDFINYIKDLPKQKPEVH